MSTKALETGIRVALLDVRKDTLRANAAVFRIESAFTKLTDRYKEENETLKKQLKELKISQEKNNKRKIEKLKSIRLEYQSDSQQVQDLKDALEVAKMCNRRLREKVEIKDEASLVDTVTIRHDGSVEVRGKGLTPEAKTRIEKDILELRTEKRNPKPIGTVKRVVNHPDGGVTVSFAIQDDEVDKYNQIVCESKEKESLWKESLRKKEERLKEIRRFRKAGLLM